MPLIYKTKKIKLNSSSKEAVITYLDSRAKLSEEELSRTFTQAELKLLCEKCKCQVDMWKWNPAEEVREKLEEEGRFRNRSSKDCLRLIARSFSKQKASLMYGSKYIEKIRREEWGLRKRDCIQYLEKHRSEGDISKSCTQIPEINNCMYDSADEVEPYIRSDQIKQEIPEEVLNSAIQSQSQELE